MVFLQNNHAFTDILSRRNTDDIPRSFGAGSRFRRAGRRSARAHRRGGRAPPCGVRRKQAGRKEEKAAHRPILRTVQGRNDHHPAHCGGHLLRRRLLSGVRHEGGRSHRICRAHPHRIHRHTQRRHGAGAGEQGGEGVGGAQKHVRAARARAARREGADRPFPRTRAFWRAPT